MSDKQPPAEIQLVNLQERASLHYMIVMPREKKAELPFTLFNRFDSSIVESHYLLRLISHLPASLWELARGWPRSAFHSDIYAYYDFGYTSEANADWWIERYAKGLGCLFIMDGVSRDVVLKLATQTDYPVVCSGETGVTGTIPLDGNTVRAIMRRWQKTLHSRMRSQGIRPEALPELPDDLTHLPPYPSPSVRMLEPLGAVVDRIRGLYRNAEKGRTASEPHRPDNHAWKENEADTGIIRGVTHIIAEKFLTLKLGFLTENSLDDDDTAELARVGIARADLEAFIRDRDPDSYLKLVGLVLANFEQLTITSDIVLCAPSVNYPLLNAVNGLLKMNKIPKKLLRLIYDSSEYYTIVDSTVFEAQSERKQETNTHTLFELVGMRGRELAALSSIGLLYALGGRNPYVRLRNTPTGQYDIQARALIAYFEDMEELNKIPQFTAKLADVTGLLQSSFTPGLLPIVRKHGSRIKLLSDLPMEWVPLDGVPLCVRSKYSRLPVTPGNGLIAHAAVRQYDIEINADNLSVMVVNALLPSDPLYRTGRFLRDILDRYTAVAGASVHYEEIGGRDRFLSAIAERKPHILIFYGHGKYDAKEMAGGLKIGRETLYAYELGRLAWHPPVVILGACETQVLHGSHLNMANLFLSTGSLSVIGTYFPVNAVYTASFIGGLVRNLVGAMLRSDPDYIPKWDDIILRTYRSHYIFDAVHALERYLRRRKKGHLVTGQLLHELAAAAEAKGIAEEEAYAHRDELFLSIFEDNPELAAAYRSLLDNGLILPQCQFYVSLGSPEKIWIGSLRKGKTGPEWETERLLLLEKLYGEL